MKTFLTFCCLYFAIHGVLNPLFASSELEFKTFKVLEPSFFSHRPATYGLAKTLDPVEENSNLYQQILDEMNLEYENIGKREAARVLQNGSHITGGLNSIGFTYKRPFIDFTISVDRNLAPDLFDDKRWIVTDTFTIDIDASRVLSNLADSKVIEIGQQNLAAFAGIVFKRKYTWVHFASSYSEGLTTNFNKLFLPFAAMKYANIVKLAPNEMLTKEDMLSVKSGGLVTAPLYTGITGMAGALARFEQMAKVEAISMRQKDSDSILLTSEKTKIIGAGVSAAIYVDFFKILKLTLLSYDLDYHLSSSYKIYLSFDKFNLRELSSDQAIPQEIGKILKNKEGSLEILAPFVISEEKNIAEKIHHKYNFLLLGGIKDSKTQQIEVTSKGRVKNFFRHYYEKMKYTEDILSKLFASLIYALTNTESSAAKLASETKRVTIEYDSIKNLLNNYEDLNIESDAQKLSLTFKAEFMTKKSTGKSGKKYRERAKFLLDRYSGVDPLIMGMIDREYLQAPMLITGQYQINTDGIRYLNSLSASVALDHFSSLCEERPKNKFSNFRSLFDNCKKALQQDYYDYIVNLSHNKITAESIAKCELKASRFIFKPSKKRAYLKNCLADLTAKDKSDWVMIPLWSLKTLTSNIVNNAYSKVHFYNLFGVENVFFHGSFKAVTANGADFVTSFHEGAFKGLGVVDHFMREEHLRAPSSVVLDQ